MNRVSQGGQVATLADIKDTVHRIDTELRSYRDEQLQQRAQIAKVEARQETMHEVHVRLEQKIDTVGTTLGKGIDETKKILTAHTVQEDADRRKILGILFLLLMSIVGYFGKMLFDHAFGGG